MRKDQNPIQKPDSIFSSTGELGASRRQWERVYVNGNPYWEQPTERTMGKMDQLLTIPERREQIGRSVFRGIVSQEVVSSLMSSDFVPSIEVALPIEEFDGSNSWLLYVARNTRERTSIRPISEMVEATEKLRIGGRTPVEKVEQVRSEGFVFRDSFDPSQIGQLHDLWGYTFGWEPEEIQALHTRLRMGVESGDRNVWFNSIEDNGVIVCAAMGERLELPSANGSLSLVESTEWRTHDSYVGQGLMSANLSMLNAQILSDMSGEHPLIYAECNFQSHAERSGAGAGFRVPGREASYGVAQMLIQNVLVRDGVYVPEGKLRDFTFMYVPVSIQNLQYDQTHCKTMLDVLKR